MIVTRQEVIQKLQSSYLNSIPVSVEKIARDHGVLLEKKYMGTLSGKIVQQEETYKITVNVVHPHTRRRFTIAHELAHFFLHKDDIGDGIIDDPLYRSSGLSNNQEQEANRLAADILMPLNKIGERVRYYEDTHRQLINDSLVRNLAEEFDVSLGSMRIRLGL